MKKLLLPVALFAISCGSGGIADTQLRLPASTIIRKPANA